MRVLDTHYAVTPDGVYIAYQIMGDGPIDVVWQSDWPGNIDTEQEGPLLRIWFEELASFSRLILHDRRGVGLSSRNVPLPNLETRVSDLMLVLDAVGSEHPVLMRRLRVGSAERPSCSHQTRTGAVHGMAGTERPVRLGSRLSLGSKAGGPGSRAPRNHRPVGHARIRPRVRPRRSIVVTTRCRTLQPL